MLRFTDVTTTLQNLRHLQWLDKDRLLGGLGAAVSLSHLEKMWETIWERWCFYEALRHR